MRRAWGLSIVTAICLLLVLGACGGPEPSLKERYRCKDIRASRGDIVQFVTAKGKVKPAESLLLKPQVEGTVSEILVRKGDRVKKGQPLVKIARDPKFLSYFSETRLMLKSARARRQALEKKLERYRQLLEEGLVAQADIEEITANLSETKLKEQVALERFQEAEQKIGRKIDPDVSEVDIRELTTAYIKAPIAGTILEVVAQTGESVHTGRPSSSLLKEGAILAMADLNRLALIANVKELDIRDLRLGQRVELRFDSMPEEVRLGTLKKIMPFGSTPSFHPAEPMEGEAGMSVFDVEIGLTGKGPTVYPGMSFKASFLVREKRGTMLLPIESVVSEGPANFVLVRRGASYTKQPITIGISDKNFVETIDGMDPEALVCDRPMVFLEGESMHRADEDASVFRKIFGSGNKRPQKN